MIHLDRTMRHGGIEENEAPRRGDRDVTREGQIRHVWSSRYEVASHPDALQRQLQGMVLSAGQLGVGLETITQLFARDGAAWHWGEIDGAHSTTSRSRAVSLRTPGDRGQLPIVGATTSSKVLNFICLKQSAVPLKVPFPASLGAEPGTC